MKYSLKFIFGFLFVFFYIVAPAQREVMMNKADEHYDRFEYADALEIYLYLAKKDDSDNLKIKIAHTYAKMNKFEEEEMWFNKVEDKEHMSPEDHYMYAQVLLADGKVKEARNFFKMYDLEVEDDNRGAKKLYSIDHLEEYYADSGKYDIINMKEINSEYSDFGPAFYNEGIVFASARFHEHGIQHEYSWDNSAFLDLYYATENAEGGFNAPELFDSKINTKYHEGPLTFNANEDIVIFSRNNYFHGHAQKSKENHVTMVELFTATKENNDWTNISKLEFDNREYTYEHPTIDGNHKTLIFSSNMPGGQGGFDLYYSKWRGSAWSKPRNLGSNINTAGNEAFPFLHKDGTLYFASDGHGGIGGLDIYSAEHWDSSTVNVKDMGYPINTHRDDFGLIMNEEKTAGYFASNRTGGQGSDDIYKFEVQGKIFCAVTVDEEKEEPVGNVNVKIYNEQDEMINELVSNKYGEFEVFVETGKQMRITGEKKLYEAGELIVIEPYEINDDGCLEVPVDSIEIVLKGYITGSDTKQPLEEAEVHIENLTKEEKVVFTTGADGYFELYAQPDCDYEVTAYKEGYLHDTRTTNTQGVDRSKTIEVDLSLELKKIEVDVSIEIKIFYAYDSDKILPEAEPHLDRLVEMLNKNPNIQVELSSHTDSRGSARYNQNLSQRRAESAVQYIVSKGVARERIVAQGYGESRPLNECTDGVDCSEEEHSINRRSEIKVLKSENL